MNDFDQNIQPNLPGFEPYPEMGSSKLPDFGQLMVQRLAPKLNNPTGFDPHAVMVKKNQIEKGEIVPDTTPEVKWPEDQVKALEDFCIKHGILGFNCGRMSPIAALAFLKQKIGGFEDISLSERVPHGYEAMGGTPSRYNANFPYSLPQDKRVILNG